MSDQVVKSFWSRPEGKTGGFFMAAILGGLGFLAYHALPYIITLLQNTLYAIGLGVAAFAVIWILLDPSFRNGVWYLYKIAMRKFTGWVVEIDPIAIIKVHIQTLIERREEMNKKMSDIKGQQIKLDRTIADNLTKITRAESIMKQADVAGNRNEVGLQAREIGRFEAFNERLKPLKKKLSDIYEFIFVLYTNSDYIIRDMSSEIQMKEIEYKAVTEGANVIRLAKNIFRGGDDEMYKQAADFLEENMSNKLGEIDSFMRETDSLINSLNYENGAFEAEGLKRLEAFKVSDYTYLLNKDAGVVPNSPEKIMIPKTKSSTASKSSGISSLLDDDNN
jgi:hypothetical protein